ncbi:MAG TPA: alpha/beta hydrolase-fold protein, partial [Trebonia sp.]|nr:alpha/beta hydrolase-fold protein [Trebonia sp.]
AGTQWIGAVVRGQDSGLDGYVGIYFWDNGSPEVMLFLRDNGGWEQLGAYGTSPLPGGSQLELTAIGDTISLALNGTQVIGISDGTLTGGAPGIMANGTAQAAGWAGGNASFTITHESTDSSGIAYYNILSANDGHGPQTLRVLQPTDPAPGVAHNFLIVLPVEAGLGDTYGDGLETMQSLNAQNQYNLTIVEPTFYIPPWYANNPNDPNLQYETFLTQELAPWMKKNLSTTGNEQVWLIGFSKSGVGGQDLILKHPNVFTLAASWDFPADISSYNEYSDSAASYGTEANFQANYQLTPSFVKNYAAPFTTANRIWIGGYGLYPTDVSDYDALLTSEAVRHTLGPSQDLAHTWDSGWVPAALASLATDSRNLSSGS